MRNLPLAKSLVCLLPVAVCLSGWFGSRATAAPDPNLKLSIQLSNQNPIISWYASNAATYQVQASSNLLVWSNASPILTGSGSLLFYQTQPAPPANLYFRVGRLFIQQITATFDSANGVLTIIGDDNDNFITVGRNAAGSILVNDGAVAITGGVPTIANTILLQVFGRAGNDEIAINEANGAMPRAYLFGEAGADTLTGGSGADVLSGAAGNDILLGKGGADNLQGGEDNDLLTGGDGDDTIQLGAGNDRSFWNPGDDNDVIEGGDGADVVEVTGGNGDEQFTTTANGIRVRFDRLNPAPFFLDINACETLVLNANGGNDTFSATGNLAALIKITADGGPGNDSLLGSNGSDVLLGGDGNDFVDGQQGNDTVFLGAGDDTFQWDPGDGSDTLEGQDGSDTLAFNGSAGNENFQFSANGSRLLFTRDLGAIVMDAAGIETVNLQTLGGIDAVTLNNLSPTEVMAVNLRLAGSLAGNTGDLQTDNIIINGTTTNDLITAAQSGADVTVLGLKTAISIFSGETNDTLTINGSNGNDTINASTLSTLFTLTLDGGPGQDNLTGSPRSDVLLGGDGDDTLNGRSGNDLLLAGDGHDTFLWNPGDGSDTLEGQNGTDLLLFNASNASETMDASPNGSRLLLFRDVGSIILDCNAVERIQIATLGGVDNLNVGDLSATGLAELMVDLGGSSGTGDAQADAITLNGSASNNLALVTGSSAAIKVTGLSASVTITNAEPALDRLVLNPLGGDDTVDASGLSAAAINLTINGGLGADVLIGSAGADTLSGGDGNDLILAGPGDDMILWNPGDDNDTLEGQNGNDRLLFNASNANDGITISANGSRALLFRDIGSVLMDCNDLEIIRIEALGGADTITVNNLAGTDLVEVQINLALAPGGVTGDGQVDSIIVNGTPADDVVTLSSGGAGMVGAYGLAAIVSILNSEAANDRLTINLLGGSDTLDASALASGYLSLIANGGDLDDVLLGSAGNDTLLGGPGDDILIGGPGLDILDGGTGSNVVIQD